MPEFVDPQEVARWHRRMAADLFNRAWELLEAARTPEQDRELLATALASWLHWREVGTPANLAVADWQVARVYAVLGDAPSAELHARASLETSVAHGLGPFYLGYAYEALARAAVVRGDAGGRLAWLERASAEAARITDEEERALLAADLDGLAGPLGQPTGTVARSQGRESGSAVAGARPGRTRQNTVSPPTRR